MSSRKSAPSLIVISSLFATLPSIALSYMMTREVVWARWFLMGLAATLFHAAIVWGDFNLPTESRAGLWLLLVKTGAMCAESLALAVLSNTIDLSPWAVVYTVIFVFSSYFVANSLGWNPKAPPQITIGLAGMFFSALMMVLFFTMPQPSKPPLTPTLTIVALDDVALPEMSEDESSKVPQHVRSPTPTPITIDESALVTQSVQSPSSAFPITPTPIPIPTPAALPEQESTLPRPDPDAQCIDEVHLFNKPVLLEPVTLHMTDGTELLSFVWALQAKDNDKRVGDKLCYRFTLKHLSSEIQYNKLSQTNHKHMQDPPGRWGTLTV